MKANIEKDYAKAFVALLDMKMKEEDVIAGLINTVRKNFHESKMAKIVNEIEKLLVKSSGGKNIVCQSARELSVENKNRIKAEFSKDDQINFSVNKELVAGVRFVFDETTELDKSFRHKLKVLFS